MSNVDSTPKPRSAFAIAVLIVTAIVLFAIFMALGTWQVYRLDWKLDLMDRVHARVNADPVAAPGSDVWPSINRQQHEYLHVRIKGQYIGEAQTLVNTDTRSGRGYWVMTPLKTQRGFIVLINRGFVRREGAGQPSVAVPPPSQQVTVTGLLRISNPDGRFLRPNDPKQGRWYSRDVAGIAAHQDLPKKQVAPYFIDAGKGATPKKPPIGGMTIVHFRNAHLPYAITWYVLAVLVIVGSVIVARYEMRKRRAHAAHGGD